jgi:hypothetical protein
MNTLLKSQVDLCVLSVIVQCAASKEYEADWLKNGGKVVRDGSGRFAKKGGDDSSSSESGKTQITIPLSEDDEEGWEAFEKAIAELSEKAIADAAKNPAERREAGLTPDLPGGKMIANLVNKWKEDPGGVKAFNKAIAGIRENLSKTFKDDNSAFGKEIKSNDDPQPPKSASPKDKLDFQVMHYAKLEQKFMSKEGQALPKEKKQSLLGKLVKAAAPVATIVAMDAAMSLAGFAALGINVAAEPLIIGLLVGRAVVPIAVDTAVAVGGDKLGKLLDVDLPDKGTITRILGDFVVSYTFGGNLAGLGALARGLLDAKTAAKVKEYGKTAKDNFDKLSKSLS